MMNVYVMNVSDLRDAAWFEAAWLIVGEERRKKVNKCKHIEDKIRSLGAGVLLAYGLSNQTGSSQTGNNQKSEFIQCKLADILPKVNQEKEIKVSYGRRGKPYLQNQKDLFFSLSHSGDYVLCVISDAEVGADIQQMKEQRPEKLERIAKKIMANEEYALWMELPEQKKAESFYRLWSCKESFVKFAGEGILMPFNSIIVKNEDFLMFHEIEGYMIAIFTEG